MTTPKPMITPIEHLQPLLTQVERERLYNNGAGIPYRVEPPIARAEHLQNMIRQLRKDRDMYQRLLADTEKMLADYEVLAGSVPF